MDESPKPTSTDAVKKLISDLFPQVTPDPNASSPDRLTVQNLSTAPLPAIQSRQELFLEAVFAGWSETKACQHASISPAVLAEWKQEPAFVAAVDQAYAGGTDYLKDLAFIRAHDSDAVLLRLLEARDDNFRRTGNRNNGNINVIVAPLFAQEKPNDPKIIIHKESENGK